jgi:hypothetical protein
VFLSAAALFLFALVPVSAQQASVTLTQPSITALIGDTVKFCLTFKNVGSAPGLGPFIDLLFDAGGANVTKQNPTPAHLCDGVTFVSATVISTNPPVPLVPEPGFNVACAPGSSSIQHPYAGFSNVLAVNGQQLTTLSLPFGSYTQTQPEIRIEVTAKIDPFADHGHPLTVAVRGGFRWNGLSSLSTPLWPPALPVETITPQAVTLTKTFAGTDNEMVPGKSLPQSFNVGVQVTPVAPATGLTVDDTLPAGGTWVSSPFPQSVSTSTTIPSQFFVGNVVSPPSCTMQFTNTASITAGTWTPIDPADAPVSLVTPPLSASSTITVKALAIQKSAHVLGTRGPIPGGQIAYHLDFQVSDYLRFGNLVVTDTLTDGQRYVPNSGTLTVSDRFGTLTVSPLDPFIAPVVPNVTHNYVCPPPNDPCSPPTGLGGGSVPFGNQYTFNVSQAMIAKATAPPLTLGVLSGGSSTSHPVNTPAVGFIDFTVDITDAFLNQHSKVSKDDPLYDDAQITGTQYTSTPTLAPTPIQGAVCTDNGSSCLAVPGDVLAKEVYAINGVKLASPQNPLTPYPVTRGDVVTFHLSKTIPSGDAKNVTIIDWLPKPITDATSFTSASITPCTSTTVLPLAGQACYTVPPIVPPVTLTVNAPADNSITFNLHTFNDPSNQPATIDIYLSVKVTTTPFPDGLLFMNEGQECETNSYGTVFCQDAIAAIKLQEPSLVIRKTILCAGGCNHLCKGGCPSTGVVNHSTIGNLGVASANSDASNVVNFLVSIENVGSGPNGAYDVQLSDSLGTFPGTIIPGSFCVRRGNGTLLTNGTDYTLSPLTQTGWTLHLNNQGSLGSIPPLDATTTASGANIILILFSVRLNPPPGVTVGKCDVNTATLQHYSNISGGQNFIGALNLPVVPPATATICVLLSDAQKRIVTTSEPHTVLPNVTIGEIVRYELSVAVPEGTVPGITFNDSLPPGLLMLGGPVVSTSGFATPPVLHLVGGSGHYQILPFVNADNDPDCERVILTFNALVTNAATNINGQILVNSFTAQSGNAPAIASPPVSVTIVEPKLTVTKTVQNISAPPLTLGAYTVTVTNSSAVTAFDVEVLDIPSAPCMQAVTNVHITSTGAVIGIGPWTAWPLKIAQMGPGSTVTITYTRNITCTRCSDMTDRVKVTWTSLPGTGTPLGASNTTGAVTPGASGAVNGERNGSGTLTPPNSYIATDSASFCGKVCGVKFSDLNGDGVRQSTEPLLGGWTINATLANVPKGSTVTAANGSYCLDLLPSTTSYLLCETPQINWAQTYPTGSPACHPVLVGANSNITGKDFGNTTCVAKLCGVKLDANQHPLAGWTIVAVPSDPSLPVRFATTDAAGNYCISPLDTPMGYTVSEIMQNGWVQIAPAATVQVKTTCTKSPNGLWIGVTTPSPVRFANRNVCAGVGCPPGQQCIAAHGQARCVPIPQVSPCATIHCAGGWHCTEVNGAGVCTP